MPSLIYSFCTDGAKVSSNLVGLLSCPILTKSTFTFVIAQVVIVDQQTCQNQIQLPFYLNGSLNIKKGLILTLFK